MSNTLTAFSPEYWSKRIQRKLYKANVFRALANMEERPLLNDGDTLNRPYRGAIAVDNYTKGTALTAQDLAATNQYLSVNKTKAILMYVDNVDKIQNKYSAANEWSEEAGVLLGNQIDGDFLYAGVKADSGETAVDTIDDGDIGGTAGNPITLTTSNISKVFGKINRKFDADNVPRANRWLVISPEFFDILWQYIAGKESLLGDNTGKNGHLGKYAGFQLYMSNNLPWSGYWTPADNPTTAATITFDGVSVEFVNSLSGTAEVKPEMHICSTTAKTIDNMVTAINTPGTAIAEATDTGYQLPTLASLRKMYNWRAEDGTTYIKIWLLGNSVPTTDPTSSESADVWTAAYQIQHLLAGQGKPIDLVIQKEPNVEMAPTISAGKLGTNIIPWTLYGVKLFQESDDKVLDVQLAASGYY